MASYHVYSTGGQLPLYAQVKRATVSKDGAAGAQTHTLLAAVAGKVLRILAGHLGGAGSLSGYLKDGAGNELLGGADGVLNLASNSTVPVPYCPVGAMETAAGQPLQFEQTSGTGDLNGYLVYIEVDPAD